MASLADAKFNALANLGFKGQVSGSTLLWLLDNGAETPCLPDAWLEMLAVFNFTGQRNDAWFELLGSLGWVGSMNDRELQFWLDGGHLPEL